MRRVIWPVTTGCYANLLDELPLIIPLGIHC